MAIGNCAHRANLPGNPRHLVPMTGFSARRIIRGGSATTQKGLADWLTVTASLDEPQPAQGGHPLISVYPQLTKGSIHDHAFVRVFLG
jgi:hypothetical protein